MAEIIVAYWPYLLIALAALLAFGWLLLLSRRKTSVKLDRRDVLDSGAAPALRNEALINAPRRTSGPADDPRPAPVAQARGDADDLTRIKGLGPKIAARLHDLGVFRIADIAAWNDEEIERIDAKLGQFQGRIRRDAWVEQAKLLNQGDETGFVEKFGKNS